jgi:hypothetical protein
MGSFLGCDRGVGPGRRDCSLRAEATEIVYDSSHGYLCNLYGYICKSCDDLRNWINALVERKSPSEFVAPFVDCKATEDSSQYEAILEELLRCPEYQRLAVSRVLRLAQVNDFLLSSALALLNDSGLVEDLWLRDYVTAGIEGDGQRATELFYAMQPLRDFHHKWIVTPWHDKGVCPVARIKFWCGLNGLSGGTARPPLEPFAEEDQEIFLKELGQLRVLPDAETAPMLFWALLASGQIVMRKVDGWETLSQPIDPETLDLAA